MNIIKTSIEGLVILEPRLFQDDRGYFFESFNQGEFESNVCQTTFVQDNESKSSYGVIRGLHFQKPPFAQSKLVRVIKGAVLDVAVDIRKGSPTFGKHVSVELTEDNVVKVRLQGHCAGCPGATMTIKGVVERLIKETYPEIQGVEAV